MSLFRSDLETAAVEAWGVSNPVVRAASSLEEAKTILRAEIASSVALSRVSTVQGLIESPETIIATPGVGALEVVTPAIQIIFGDRGVNFPAATTVIPRPSDGVTRELIGIAVGAPIDAATFQTFGAFAAAPTVERLRGGIFTPLTLGVDYSNDLPLGTVTIIAAAPNLLQGDQILLTASWVGEWTVSIVALEDGSIVARRGFTYFPTLDFFQKADFIYGEVLVVAVRGVNNSTGILTQSQIDHRPAHYLAPSSVLRFFAGAQSHRHDPSIPGDGAQVSFNAFNQNATDGITELAYAIAVSM